MDRAVDLSNHRATISIKDIFHTKADMLTLSLREFF